MYFKKNIEIFFLKKEFVCINLSSFRIPQAILNAFPLIEFKTYQNSDSLDGVNLLLLDHIPSNHNIYEFIQGGGTVICFNTLATHPFLNHYSISYKDENSMNYFTFTGSVQFNIEKKLKFKVMKQNKNSKLISFFFFSL